MEQKGARASQHDAIGNGGLAFSKEFLGDPVIPGDTVTLRFTIDNIHPTDDGYTLIRNTPWPIIAGSIPLILITLGFTFLGEALRDQIDPKLRKTL